MDAGRKHLRGDANSYNQWVAEQLATLFVSNALPFLVNRYGAGLIDFLESRALPEMQEEERVIFDSFSTNISRNAFIPILGNASKTISPQDCILSDPGVVEDLYSLLNKEIEWEDRYLIEPEWCSQKRATTIEKFGGKKLKTTECIKIIGRGAEPGPQWCTKALDIILGWIDKAPEWKFEGTESRGDLANTLKNQPIFYTFRKNLRPLTTEEACPLFLFPAIGEPLDIPSFISLDFLHPEVGNTLEKEEREKFGKRLESLFKHGLSPFRPKEIIEKGVIPAILPTENKNPLRIEDRKTLLIFLAQLDPTERKFDDIKPFPWFERVRTKLAMNTFVPNRDGNWSVAWKVYAGADWGAQERLSVLYEDVPERAILAPVQDPIHNGIPIEKWKSLYRYLGVSWEPKILPFDKYPDYVSRYHFPNIHSSVSDEDWEDYAKFVKMNPIYRTCGDGQ